MENKNIMVIEEKNTIVTYVDCLRYLIMEAKREKLSKVENILKQTTNDLQKIEH